MPGKTLPIFSKIEIQSHTTAKSCYVTQGSRVYDVTAFLNDHPGGGDLILEHAGQDVSATMSDCLSHEHSEAAYEILEEYHIGFVGPGSKLSGNGTVKRSRAETTVGQSNDRLVYSATGMSREEDLSLETDAVADYQAHKFLDLSRPLFPQLWYGGFSKSFYLEQVHRPRHYKGGASAPLFGNFLEPLSKTAWWIVPSIWAPLIAYGTVVGFSGLSNSIVASAYWLSGLFIWTLVEYGLHRCLFHVDKYVFLPALYLVFLTSQKIPPR